MITNILKSFALISLLVTSPWANQIMKITLSDKTVSEEKIAQISKMSFSETQMITSQTYLLDDIQKIEFIDEGTSSIIIPKEEKEKSGLAKRYNIGLRVTNKTLSLQLPKKANIEVNLFSVNGRLVSSLFTGNAKAGRKDIALTKSNLATGVYSLVVKVDNTLFVKKIIQK